MPKTIASKSDRRQSTPPVNSRVEVVWRGIVDTHGRSAAITLTHASSEALEAIIGYPLSEALALPDFLISLASNPLAKDKLQAHFRGLLKEHVATLDKVALVNKAGKVVLVEIRTQRLRQFSKERFEVLSTISKHAEQKTLTSPRTLSTEAEDTIRHLAFHDTLTDLPNRIQLGERLADTLSSAAQEGKKLAVLFIDLDGFKKVNDTLGHQAGDELLVEVARRLRSSVRDGDLVARFGGDEFVIVLKYVKPGDTERIAADILQAIEYPIKVMGREVHISSSIGVAIGPDDGTTPEELLRNADNALYQAKEAGRATIRAYTSAMHLAASAKFLMEESLRKAITRHEFFLEYQPMRDAVSHKIIAAEALIRWRHPLRDIAFPHEFIPLAEEAGIIEEIGRWMVGEALSQIQQWQKAGIPIPTISLNISAREFRHKNFVPDLIKAFKTAKVSTKSFQLELTESAAMERLDIALPKLTQLREAGFVLVLDDFGTGYSSLAQLQQLPFSHLKIDQLFMREVNIRPESQSIMQAIINLGHTLGMKICVEGVETESQSQFLQTSGCDTLQGHFISYPLSESDFLELITKEAKV